jgi:cytochrome c oxidase subunit 2
MTTRTWFKAEKPGEYEIACAELCGLGHYRMRGFLHVHDAAGFEKWYSDQMAEKAAALAPPPPADTTTAASPATTTDTVAASTTATDTTATAADTAAH